jgi:ribosomal protein L11 methyltransferase
MPRTGDVKVRGMNAETESPPSFVARMAIDGAQARAAAEALSECLDPADTAVSAFESAPGQWQLELHLAQAPDLEALRALVATVTGAAAAAAMTLAPVAKRDWVKASLAGLKPVQAGRFLLHGAHHRNALPARAITIEIEAALAFGTGHHGTTRGCLLALDRILRAHRPQRVLDVGTGTGVLAIAAAKALRRPVLASDIDPTSVKVARANARANGVGAFVSVLRAAGLAGKTFRRRGPYPLAFANILLLPLVRLADPLSRRIAPGGFLVLSGLLRPQANAALSAYRMQGLYLVARIDLDEWSTLILRRPVRGRPAK